MVRVGVLISAFIAGAAATLVVLYALLFAGPDFDRAEDVADALEVVAGVPLREFPPGSVVYVKNSVGPMLLKRLQSTYPSLRLLPYSARPEDNGCKPGLVGACQRNDFVVAELLCFLMPRTAVVTVSTYNTGGTLILFKFGGRWRVIANRGYVI